MNGYNIGNVRVHSKKDAYHEVDKRLRRMMKLGICLDDYLQLRETSIKVLGYACSKHLWLLRGLPIETYAWKIIPPVTPFSEFSLRFWIPF